MDTLQKFTILHDHFINHKENVGGCKICKKYELVIDSINSLFLDSDYTRIKNLPNLGNELEGFATWLDKKGWNLESKEVLLDVKKHRLGNCKVSNFIKHLNRFHNVSEKGITFLIEKIEEYQNQGGSKND